MFKVIDVKPNTPEWLEWRRSGIGASDVPAICGICPWKTPKDIYNVKLGLSENKKNAAMQRGHDYEDIARDAFHEQHMHHVAKFEPICIENTVHSHYRASLDGYSATYPGPGGCILEIKVPGKKGWEEAINGVIPKNYMYQMQWQMYVSHTEICYYFVYNPDTNEHVVKIIYRNDGLIDEILVKVSSFWNDLQKEEAPSDKKDTYFLFDEYDSQLLFEMKSIKDDIKELEEFYNEKLKALLEKYKSCGCSLETDKYVLYKSERQNTDYKRAAEDAGVDLEKYKKPVTVSWTIKAKR